MLICHRERVYRQQLSLLNPGRDALSCLCFSSSHACTCIRLRLLCSYSEAWEGRNHSKKGGLHDNEAARNNSTPEKPKVDCGASTAQSEGSTVPSPDCSSPDAPAKRRPSLPRIYYATRTHSQIGQVCIHYRLAAGCLPNVNRPASRCNWHLSYTS